MWVLLWNELCTIEYTSKRKLAFEFIIIHVQYKYMHIFSTTASKSHIRIHPLHAHTSNLHVIKVMDTKSTNVGLTCESYHIAISCFCKSRLMTLWWWKELWSKGSITSSASKRWFQLPLNNGYVERSCVFEKTIYRVRTHTFKVSRTLRSIVSGSHCFWNKVNSRKQQPAAVVTHLHQKTFSPSCQDDIKSTEKRYMKQFGRGFTFLLHCYSGNIFVCFMPRKSAPIC